VAFQICEVCLVSAAGEKLPIAAGLKPVIICGENRVFFYRELYPLLVTFYFSRFYYSK